MKLHYRNELMPIVFDKYAVRKYLEELGHPKPLNELIVVYDIVSTLALITVKYLLDTSVIW